TARNCMKRLWILFWLLASTVALAGESFTVGTQKYEDVVFVNATNASVSFRHKTGIETLRIFRLPADLPPSFPADLNKARDTLAPEAAKKKEAEQKAAEEKQRAADEAAKQAEAQRAAAEARREAKRKALAEESRQLEESYRNMLGREGRGGG